MTKISSTTKCCEYQYTGTCLDLHKANGRVFDVNVGAICNHSIDTYCFPRYETTSVNSGVDFSEASNTTATAGWCFTMNHLRFLNRRTTNKYRGC